jgi:membrane protease YdiL (CAAX protease family)
MSKTERSGIWSRVPVIVRAVVTGIAIGMVAANVWPILLFKLGVQLAAGVEAAFLIVYIWWAGGGGPPSFLKAARADRFRAGPLKGAQWAWGLLAAVCFAGTIHAAIVVLFRFVPFPAQAFHLGYDFSFIHSRALQWLVCIVSAASAGICEETGFRGYMQQPIEKRHGSLLAILISSLFFVLLHLTKDWALIGMVPIIFGAGLLLGTLAWASRSLVFCMIGHTIMDIGLFGYWWSQIDGTFSQRPISETGMDHAFLIECGLFAALLLVTSTALARLRRSRSRESPLIATS